MSTSKKLILPQLDLTRLQLGGGQRVLAAVLSFDAHHLIEHFFVEHAEIFQFFGILSIKQVEHLLSVYIHVVDLGKASVAVHLLDLDGALRGFLQVVTELPLLDPVDKLASYGVLLHYGRLIAHRRV